MLIYANLCKFMQMNCDVIGHVTALDQSEQSKPGHKPSTQLTRSAPLVTVSPQNNVSGAIIGDGTLRPLVTVSLQNGVIYANLCKFMQMSCDVIGHVTALDQSEQSKLGHKPSIQLTGSAPW